MPKNFIDNDSSGKDIWGLYWVVKEVNGTDAIQETAV